MSYHSTGNRRSWNGRGLGKVRGGEGRWNSSVCIYWTDAISLGSYIVSFNNCDYSLKGGGTGEVVLMYSV